MVELFTRKLGYKRVLLELGEDPTSDQLRRGLSDWLREPDRRTSDVVVFYYSGHGVTTRQRKHYLMTSDSQETKLVATALPTEDLAEMLDGTPIQQFLVLLDTCYSGQGGSDFSRVAAEIAGSFRLNEGLTSGIYAIAAARPKDEAQQGAFAPAFVQAVENPTGPYAGNRQPYLLLDPLVNSINEIFQERRLGQRSFLYSSGVGSVPHFFVNILAVEISGGLDLETQRRWIRASREDLIAHWGPRARGSRSNPRRAGISQAGLRPWASSSDG